MSDRQSSYKQNGGRGVPNNGRGNGQPRPQSTATTTSRPLNSHHSTTSTDAIVNNLLGRNSNSSRSSSAQTPWAPASHGNTTTLSKQYRQKAEAAIKSMKESNRQTELQGKNRADEHARTQAETLRLAQEADDNILNENQNFMHTSDAHFNIHHLLQGYVTFIWW
jgi:hypothetical protein